MKDKKGILLVTPKNNLGNDGERPKSQLIDYPKEKMVPPRRFERPTCGLQMRDRYPIGAYQNSF
jgi:hypothetical protein